MKLNNNNSALAVFFSLVGSALGQEQQQREPTPSYFSEIVIRDDAVHNSAGLAAPLPHTYIESGDLPQSFNWADVDGKSYLTKSLNQHIPQYCGSCWAHGALSSLGDRIKIARKAQGDDINLSIQFILNCGTESAGSCHGGYVSSSSAW